MRFSWVSNREIDYFMENSITFSLSPLQALLSVAFQIWLVVFPILIIRKLNFLISLLQDHIEENESPDGHA